MDESNSGVSNSYRANSMCNNWSISISSNTIIGNISNISIIPISSVGNMLCATIRKSNRVRSRGVTSTISSFSSIKTRTRVVIIDSVGVGIGVWLIRINSSSMANHRMCKDRGMSYHWSMSNSDRTGHCMNHRVSNTMDSSGTMKTVRSISHSSNTGSEGLGLSSASVFSLERL